jgi:hypothetical protein
MRGKMTLLSLVLCASLFTLADRSFSRARSPQTPAEQQRWMQEQQLKHQQRMEELRRQMQEQRLDNEQRQKAARKLTDEYASEAFQEAIGATDEQWRIIQPRFERVRQLASTPSVQIAIYSFGAGGGSSASSSAQGSGGAGGTSGRSLSSGTASGAGTSGGGYGFAGGGLAGPVKKKVGDTNLGWQWQRASLRKSSDKLSEGEKACEQLLDVLETKSPDARLVRQQVEAVRRAREQQGRELQKAQELLREVATVEQEARFVLMGYLE